jgi:hypothetical protein
MGMNKKHHVDVQYTDRTSDKDDCKSYSECLNKAARQSRSVKLPCVGCVDYIQARIQIETWLKKSDGYLW